MPESTLPHRNPLQPVALTKPSSRLANQPQACSQQVQPDSNTTTFLHLPHRLPNGHETDQNLTYYNSSRRQRRPVSDTALRPVAQQSRPASRSHSSAILHHQSLSSTRRSRQPIACDPCRASKRKCSGGQPCISCLKRGGKVECYYDKAAELKLLARQKTLAMTSRGQREAMTSKKKAEATIGRAAKTMDTGPVVTRKVRSAARRASADVNYQAHPSNDDRCDDEASSDVIESEGDDAYMEVSFRERKTLAWLTSLSDYSGPNPSPSPQTVPTQPNYLSDANQSWTPASSRSIGSERTRDCRGVESREPVSSSGCSKGLRRGHTPSSAGFSTTTMQPVTPSPRRRRHSGLTRTSTANSQQSSVEKHEMSSPTTPSQQDRSPSQSSAFSGMSSQRSEMSTYQEAGCQRLFGEAMPSKSPVGSASSLLPRHLLSLRGSWATDHGRTGSAFGIEEPPRLPKPFRPLGSSNTIGFSCIGRPAFSKPMRLSTIEPHLETRAIAADGLVGDGAFLPSAREGSIPAWIKPYPYPRSGFDPRASYGTGQTTLSHHHLWATGGAPDVSSGHTLAPLIRPPYAPTSQHRSTTSATSSPAGPLTKRYAPPASDSRMPLPPLAPRDMPLSLLGHPPSS